MEPYSKLPNELKGFFALMNAISYNKRTLTDFVETHLSESTDVEFLISVNEILEQSIVKLNKIKEHYENIE